MFLLSLKKVCKVPLFTVQNAHKVVKVASQCVS